MQKLNLMTIVQKTYFAGTRDAIATIQLAKQLDRWSRLEKMGEGK